MVDNDSDNDNQDFFNPEEEVGISVKEEVQIFKIIYIIS